MTETTAQFHGTTILSVRRGERVAMGGDGQVTLGNMVVKASARKVRRIYQDRILAGFAGATADAFTLFERFEAKLEKHQGNLVRSAIELTKDWRTDRVLRRLEAMLAVADQQERLEASKIAVTSPVLGELDGGAREVAELLELAFEAFEQGEGVGGSAGVTAQYLAIAERTHLARVALHHGVAEGDLSIAADGDGAVSPHGQDGGAVRIEALAHSRPLRPTSCVLPEGGKRRRCGPGGRNQGACRPGSWRCRRVRAAPGRHANPYSIQADA